MDDLESALFSVWGYSNYIFCLPRGCPMQYSLLSHILHYSREGALFTVFCTANMQKTNSRFCGSERESRNMTHIWRTLVPTWVNSSSILLIYYGKYSCGCGNKSSTCSHFPGKCLSNLAALWRRTSANTSTSTVTRTFSSLFFSCANSAPFLKESLHIPSGKDVHEFPVGDLSKAAKPWGQLKMYSFLEHFSLSAVSCANFRCVLP